jgi:hypothetical protein
MLDEGKLNFSSAKHCLHVDNPGTYNDYTLARLFSEWELNHKGFAISNVTVRELQQRTGIRTFYVTYAHDCCERAMARATDQARRFGFSLTVLVILSMLGGSPGPK